MITLSYCLSSLARSFNVCIRSSGLAPLWEMAVVPWYRSSSRSRIIELLMTRSPFMVVLSIWCSSFMRSDISIASDSSRSSCLLKHVFIRPFEKRDVLCRGNVRPSVRPSVRPRFPDFSSTCFEISIWNLVYTFSRWHDMSSLSCITIGSFWPSLQPKVGQTHFLQSWPHKSR